MNYKVKCTHCISLLKNIKALENAEYTMHDGECYIDVNDDSDKFLIERIEFHQNNTYWYYQRLSERS